MTTEKQQSAAIVNLDSVPPIAVGPAEGGPSFARIADGVCAITTAMTAGSTYQIARIPSNAKLKESKVKLDAGVTTFAANAGFYYSDSPTDMVGEKAALAGTAINATYLGSAVDLHATTTWNDLSQVLAGANFDEPLWQALGLSADPQCQIDFVLTNTSTNSGSGNVAGRVSYTV